MTAGNGVGRVGAVATLGVALGAAAVAAGLVLAGLWLTARRVVGRLERDAGQSPRHTIWEFLFSLASTNLRELTLTEQRAQQGTLAEHPMGSPVTVDWLAQLTWDPATVRPAARPRRQPVHLQTVLGPRCAKPLVLALPVLVAPMGYGVGLSAEAKVALAEASSLAGTATSSGEGPYLPEERAIATRWILQASRAGWAHQKATVRLADMVEIQVGQGAEAGIGVVKRARTLPRRVARATDHPGRPLRIHGGLPRNLAGWVQEIRRLHPGIPVGVKVPASAHLERDLAVLTRLGVDVITVDGGEAASSGSPAVIGDQFGIPAAVAALRADRWLRAQGLRHSVSLVVSGGIRGAGDAAKMIALGADAVAVGTVLLFAMSHGQVAPLLPWRPPTELVFAQPNAPRSFHPGRATENLARWFQATREELRLVLQALGVGAIAELRPRLLVALSEEAGRLFGVAHIGDPDPGPVLDKLDALIAHYDVLARVLARQYRALAKPQRKEEMG